MKIILQRVSVDQKAGLHPPPPPPRPPYQPCEQRCNSHSRPTLSSKKRFLTVW